MIITVYDKSIKTGKNINYNSIIFKLSAMSVPENKSGDDLWFYLTTLIAGGAQKILIDMKDLDFIDSRGIGILINAAKRIRTLKGDIVLFHISQKVEQIFSTVNLQKFIMLFEDEETAMNYIRLI